MIQRVMHQGCDPVCDIGAFGGDFPCGHRHLCGTVGCGQLDECGCERVYITHDPRATCGGKTGVTFEILANIRPIEDRRAEVGGGVRIVTAEARNKRGAHEADRAQAEPQAQLVGIFGQKNLRCFIAETFGVGPDGISELVMVEGVFEGVCLGFVIGHKDQQEAYGRRGWP